MEKWYEDGRLRFAVGIEDTFVPQTLAGQRSLDEYELTQHYRFWTNDLELAADTGATMIRYGFPWYRMNPEPGRYDWEWSDRVVDKLDEVGLEAIVDLMHYGTPLWLDNEFLNASYPERLAEYAFALAERYRDRLCIYTPLNEPSINAQFCGETAQWPPYLTGDDGYVKLSLALTRGMVASAEAISAATGNDVSFVHVEATFRYTGVEPPPDRIALLQERRYLITDLLLGLVDEAHPLIGYLQSHGCRDDTLTWFREHAWRPDVLGINYYPHLSNHAFDREGALTRVNDWTEGLVDVIGAWHKRYALPLYLTETSMTGSPDQRIAWLDDSLRSISDLRVDGVPVVGYTWWPLFDLVDWDYRRTTAPVEQWLIRMGLYDIEVDSIGTMHRRRTPVVDRFIEHARDEG